VLIVEDDPENGMIMEQMLCHAGFSVRLVCSGAAGIEEFREWCPHFIWMDMRMPEMSGADAARRIRELTGGRKVKIAAITASAFASEREEVLAAGMDDFVRKPYHSDKIFDCMVRQLGVRFRQRGKSARAQ
jgi:CheY-like chemotaxis protein